MAALYWPETIDDVVERVRFSPGEDDWWAVQFLIRRCAWHMLDHAWEMEDRDLSSVGPESPQL